MSESERMPGYRNRSQVPPIASRPSRIAYDRPADSISRWHAAPIPDSPAPTMSTSTCSGSISAEVSLRLEQRAVEDPPPPPLVLRGPLVDRAHVVSLGDLPERLRPVRRRVEVAVELLAG